MASCTELPLARSAKIPRLTSFGQVKSQLPTLGNEPLAMTRTDFVKEITAEFQKQGGAMVGEASARLKEKMSGPQAFKVGQMSNLGIAFSEPDVIGVAMTVDIEQGGQKFTRLGVMSMTLANGIPVTLNLFREYKDASSLTALVADSKLLARAFLKANP
jgi:hypothetical protein